MLRYECAKKIKLKNKIVFYKKRNLETLHKVILKNDSKIIVLY